MRAAREAKDLALEKIADELRIEAHVLLALEEDRLDDIPVAPVFIKGYIKQYGRQLGLAYTELHAAFIAQSGGDEVTLRPSQPIHLRDERQITVWIIATLVLALVAVFLLVWWLGDERVLLPSRATQSPTSPITEPVVRDAPPPRAPAEPLPANADRGPAPAPGNAVSAAPGAAAVTGDSGVADGDRAAAVPNPASAPAEAPQPPPQTLPAPTPRPGAIAVTFRFREESWAEITGADDDQAFYDLARAGAELRFALVPPIRVLLGNANVVDVTVDGAPFAIPERARRANNVAIFVIPASTN